MDIAAFQATIAATYGERDADRGTAPTVAWLCEEVGELAQAARKGTPAQQLHELGLSLDDAAQRYAAGCPVCGTLPCDC